MGTNFYLNHKATLTQKKRIKELVDEDKFDDAKEIINEATKVIHIGKRSYGWQFHFDLHRNKEWETTEDGMEINPKDFTFKTVKKYIEDKVNSGEWELKDEYDDEFTPDVFWKEEVGDSLYNDNDKYINLEQYYRKYPNRDKFHFEKTEFTSKDGLRYDTRWFS